jgi:hypothetical protein
MSLRSDFVNKALSWVGTKEGSDGHKQIVADYNKACDPGRQGNVKTAGCAMFTGAVAEETGNVLKDGFGVPVDYSCGTGSHSIIEKAKKAGIWVEADDYVPNKEGGDEIIYDWSDSGKGDDTSGHDHIGIIVSVGTKNFKVVEGNKSNAVGTRTVEINGKYIRGFVVPKFADEVVTPTPAPVELTDAEVDAIAKDVIAGKYGNNPDRKKKLVAEYGENGYSRIQNRVNEILKGNKTDVAKPTDKPYELYKCYARHGLYVRSGRGTGYSKLAILSYKEEVKVFDVESGWAKVDNDRIPEGYCAFKYLKKC